MKSRLTTRVANMPSLFVISIEPGLAMKLSIPPQQNNMP
jgi:hypothetical protein